MPFLPPNGQKDRQDPYIYRKALGITEEESRVMVREFYESEEFKNLKPFKHSAYTLSQLKDRGHRIYAVTGRQSVVREGTEVWLNKYFPGVFDDLVLTNSFTPKEIPKADLCLALNISTIIDDGFRTCVECHDNGIKAINFVGKPMYPWCHERHPEIKTASNWIEVLNEVPLPWISNSP